jgi:hypothetical protein
VLELLTLKKRTSGGGDSSNGNGNNNGKARWWDERRIRVWMPPGFKQGDAPPGGFPALVMCDGQNMFEDWLAHQVSVILWMQTRIATGGCYFRANPFLVLSVMPVPHLVSSTAA